jgi:hypothetical protein
LATSGQALAGHFEHADFVGGAEAVLHRRATRGNGGRARPRNRAPHPPDARPPWGRRSGRPW